MLNGVKAYVLDSSAFDENNELLVRQISTEIVRIPDNLELGTGKGKTPR